MLSYWILWFWVRLNLLLLVFLDSLAKRLWRILWWWWLLLRRRTLSDVRCNLWILPRANFEYDFVNQSQARLLFPQTCSGRHNYAIRVPDEPPSKNPTAYLRFLVVLWLDRGRLNNYLRYCLLRGGGLLVIKLLRLLGGCLWDDNLVNWSSYYFSP